jgi:hypothetical protein
MRTRSILSTLILTAAVLTFAFNNAEAGVPGILIPPGLPGSSVNVQVNGYLPAPPGVVVRVDSGRPYYVERDRRVYMEREPEHYKKKHYKKEKHHEDRGKHKGHYKD